MRLNLESKQNARTGRQWKWITRAAHLCGLFQHARVLGDEADAEAGFVDLWRAVCVRERGIVEHGTLVFAVVGHAGPHHRVHGRRCEHQRRRTWRRAVDLAAAVQRP